MIGEKIKSFLVEKVPSLEKIVTPAKKAVTSISEELLEPWQRKLVERQYGIKLDESSTWGGAIEELTKLVPKDKKEFYPLKIMPGEIREALSENLDILSPESRDAFLKNPDEFVANLFSRDLDKGLSWDIKKVLAASPVIAAALLYVAPGAYDYLQSDTKSEQVYVEEKEKIIEITPYEKFINKFREIRETRNPERLEEFIEEYKGNFPSLYVLRLALLNYASGRQNRDFDLEKFNLFEKILLKTESYDNKRYNNEQSDSFDAIEILNGIIFEIKDRKDLIIRIHGLQKMILDRIPVISNVVFISLYSDDTLSKNLKEEIYQKMTPQMRVVADISVSVRKQYEKRKKIDYEPVLKRLQSAKEDGILLQYDEIRSLISHLPDKIEEVSISVKREFIRSFIDITDPSISIKLASLFLPYSKGLEDIQFELIEKSAEAGWQINNQDLLHYLSKVGSNERLQKRLIEITRININEENIPSFQFLYELKSRMHSNLFTAFLKEKLGPEWQLLTEFEETKDENSKIAVLEKIKKRFGSASERKNVYFWDKNKYHFFEYARNTPRFQESLLKSLPNELILWLARDETYRLDRAEDRGEYAKVRKESESYTAPFLYAMIAQGQELNNTSVFEVLYSKFKEKLPQYGGLDNFLREVDQKENLASRFVLTLSFFGKLGELVSDEKSAEYWGEKIISFFSGKEMDKNSVFLTPTLENIFSGSAPKLKSFLEKKFLELAEKFPAGSKEKQMFELILAQYGNKFSNERKEDALKISAEARKSFEKYFSIPVKDWIDQKGVLQSHMFFHPDHAYHFARLLEAAENEGYKIVNRAVKDKKDAEITLERQSNGYPAKTLRIVATISGNPEITKTLEFDKTPIIGHRGHSYQLEQTFSEKANITKPTLFFFGSCGGFRAIPKIARKYGPKAVFLATLGVGKGEVNTQIFLYLQRSIGEQGITKWDKLAENMSASLKKDAKEYVFPHQLPILQLFDKK